MASTPTTGAGAPSRRVPRRAAAAGDGDDTVVDVFRFRARNARRATILAVVTFGLFAALFLRLWALEVLSGTKYVRQAQAHAFRTVRLQAPRGQILDRNGKPLVTNAIASSIQLWPADLPSNYKERYAELRRLANVAQVPLYEIASGIKHRPDDPVVPVTVRDAAAGPMVTYLYEHSNEFPGVTIGRSYVRHYPYQQLAAQVLGYVGAISQEQLRSLGAKYDPNDEIGQSGVEATYDGYLRGEAGEQELHIDSLGRPLSAVTTSKFPTPGNAVRLTLDLRLQQAAEKALQHGIELARAGGHWAADGGAIVALDPNDGSILALASSPTYKPSVFSGRVTTKALAAAGLTNKTAQARNYPALDRAIQATYPPGSTFKPVTALAAMEEHLVTPSKYLPCTGTYQSPHDRAHHTFTNWDPYVDQQMNLATALAMSCDTYFYQLGDGFYALPPNRGQPLQKWARIFGFGRSTGSDVGPEATGRVPTIAWRRHYFRTAIDKLWKPGNSIQLAIGQGDLTVTPLQMARFYALLANGGKLVTPHVLMDVETPNGTPVPLAARTAPQPVRVDPNALAAVRKGLWEATHMTFGTSYGVFGHFPVSVAGKTGTAEKVVSLPGYVGNQDQSWWCGYGPTQAPTLVVCAVIENGGHGGTAAAPAAADVFAQYFHVKAKPIVPTKTD